MVSAGRWRAGRRSDTGSAGRWWRCRRRRTWGHRPGRRRCRRGGRGRWRTFDGGRVAVRRDAAQDEEDSGAGVGEEEVAVGRGADEARHGERAAARRHVLYVVGALHGGVVAAGVEGDLEAAGRDGPCTCGARDDVRLVVDGLVGVGLGQVSKGDLVADAGGLLVPVGEGGLAGEEGLLGGSGDRSVRRE